jgi:hypothetical protein
LSELIGFIAALCTIAVAAGSTYTWLRGHALIVRVHDPQKNVEQDNLSVIDIARAMKRMAKTPSAISQTISLASIEAALSSGAGSPSNLRWKRQSF